MRYAVRGAPRHAVRMHGMGDWFSDAVDSVVSAVTHPADTAGAAWSIATHPEDNVNAIVNYGPDDFVKAVAGGWNWYAGGVSDVATWAAKGMSDFAKSDIGKNILTVATSALYMTLAPVLGPLTLLTFAIPGLIAGDDFGDALLDGFVGQTQRALTALGGSADISSLPQSVQDQVYQLSDTIHQQVATASQYLDQLGAGDIANMTYEKLAQAAQTRMDSAAAALVSRRHNPDEVAQYAKLHFDPVTGVLQNSIPNAQGVAGGAAFQQANQGLLVKAPVITSQAAGGQYSTLNRSTALESAITAAYPKAPATPATPASVVAALPPHQAIVAATPTTHAPLSTPAKVGIGGAILAGLGIAAKVGGLF